MPTWRPRFDSWLGKICWRRDRLPTPVFLGFPHSSAVKESTRKAGDLGSIPGLGRSPGEGKGYPLQYSCLENSMDCIVHGVAESDMTEQLSLSQSAHSLWPLGLQLARFLCPWNFPNKYNGVFQARIISSARISSQPRDLICIYCILHWQVDSLSLGPPGKPRI